MLGRILRLACVALLVGRGIQAIIGDLPLRTILWNQLLLEPVVTGLFGVPWKDYVTSETLDFLINSIGSLVGLFFVIIGVWAGLNKAADKLIPFLKISAGILAAIFFLKFMEKSFYIGMLIEHGAQFMAPLAYAWWLEEKNLLGRRLIMVKLCISATFLGHALFAVGFHPVPGGFIDMIINVLGFSQEGAVEMLFVAGSIDIACALFLFIPPLDRYALMFMVAWGLITASARVLAHVDIDHFWFTWHQWGVEMIFRLPHGLLPLAVFSIKRRV